MIKIRLIFLALLLFSIIQVSQQRQQKPDLTDEEKEYYELAKLRYEREMKRKQEQKKQKERLKKVDGFNPPPEQGHWNKHREEDDGQVIKNDKKSKNARQERKDKLNAELRANIEEAQKLRDKHKDEREQRRKQRQEKLEEFNKKRQEKQTAETESEINELKSFEKKLKDQEMQDIKEQEQDDKDKEEEIIKKYQKEMEYNKEFASSSEKWLEEWEKHMSDFTADEMLTFELGAKSQEVFLEDIDKPCKLRGAFYLGMTKRKPIQFYIESPSGQKIYSVKDVQGIFSIDILEETLEKGTYRLIFENRLSSDKKQVSLAIDISDNDEHLTGTHVTGLEDVAKNILNSLKDSYQQNQFQRNIMNGHLENIRSTLFNMSAFYIIESIFIVICTVAQIYYIKKMLDNKVVV